MKGILILLIVILTTSLEAFSFRQGCGSLLSQVSRSGSKQILKIDTEGFIDKETYSIYTFKITYINNRGKRQRDVSRIYSEDTWGSRHGTRPHRTIFKLIPYVEGEHPSEVGTGWAWEVRDSLTSKLIYIAGETANGFLFKKIYNQKLYDELSREDKGEE